MRLGRRGRGLAEWGEHGGEHDSNAHQHDRPLHGRSLREAHQRDNQHTLTRRIGLMKNRPLVSRPRVPAVSVHVKWLVGVVVVALLLGGTATAAKKITGKDVADSSLTGKDLRDSSLTGADIRDRSLSARDFSESIRGPAGPPGPPGATGATGPNGFTLLTQHVSAVASVPMGGPQTATALCGAGELAVSGGWLQTNANTLIVIAASLAGADPATGRDGWTVLARDGSNTAGGTFEAIAYCAPLPAGAAAARSAAAPRSALGKHQQAWQALHKVATAMRASTPASNR